MNALRRLWASLIADDPQPEPSRLDVWDGVRRELCSVVGCPEAPTASPHGWAVCEQHSPSAANVRSATRSSSEHTPALV